MSDEIPETERYFPNNPEHVFLKRIGSKCIVRATPNVEGSWLEIGGVARKGDINVDIAQARVYYRANKNGTPECRVIMPDDVPFRANRKGKTKDRTKSFDAEGNPVPQVRLLYALKTKQFDDRRRAIKALPVSVWGTPLREEIISRMRSLEKSEDKFITFVGVMIANDLSQEIGMANWNLWKGIADKAAEFSQNRLAIANGEMGPDPHYYFIQAVKETTVRFEGLPTQNAIKQLWEKNVASGEWITVRNTLGFQWIPSESDWKKSWPAYNAAAKVRAHLKTPEITDLPAHLFDKMISGIWPPD